MGDVRYNKNISVLVTKTLFHVCGVLLSLCKFDTIIIPINKKTINNFHELFIFLLSTRCVYEELTVIYVLLKGQILGTTENSYYFTVTIVFY